MSWQIYFSYWEHKLHSLYNCNFCIHSQLNMKMVKVTHLIVLSSLAVAKTCLLGCVASPHSSPSECPPTRSRGCVWSCTDTSYTSLPFVPASTRSPLQHTLRTIRPAVVTWWAHDHMLTTPIYYCQASGTGSSHIQHHIYNVITHTTSLQLNY